MNSAGKTSKDKAEGGVMNLTLLDSAAPLLFSSRAPSDEKLSF